MITEVIKPTFIRTDQRGDFIEIADTGLWQTVVYGRMNSGAVLGNHYHKRTTILFHLTRGRARVDSVHVETCQRSEIILEENTGTLLPTMVAHAIRFLEAAEFIMLKDLRFDPNDPDTYPFPVTCSGEDLSRR